MVVPAMCHARRTVRTAGRAKLQVRRESAIAMLIRNHPFGPTGLSVLVAAIAMVKGRLILSARGRLKGLQSGSESKRNAAL